VPPARADALRNRTAVLEAAAALVADGGARALRMADVSRRAGVGPGTVYRAFGGRSQLLLALLDESERELQEEIIRGAPPLGPGAPPRERLLAFVEALHRLNVAQREILMAADADAGRRSGAHQAWRLHLALLLAELRPEADADVLAELLLAALAAPVQAHLIDDRRKTQKAVRAEVLRLAGDVAGG
jgi:AcrR family transcriptional regulator